MSSEKHDCTLDTHLQARTALARSRQEPTMNATTDGEADRAGEVVDFDGLAMTLREGSRLAAGMCVCLAVVVAGLFVSWLPTPLRVVLGAGGLMAMPAWCSWVKSLMPDGEQMEARRERLAVQQRERKERENVRRCAARDRGRRLLGLEPVSGGEDS